MTRRKRSKCSARSSGKRAGKKLREIEVTFLPKQVPVFDCPARNVVYLKGRRAGGTVGAVHRLIELAHKRPNSRHLWVDTVHRNIDKYVRRHFLPRLKHTRYSWDTTRRVLHFSGGSFCDFGSAQRPENLEGFGYDYLWVNEAGIVLQNEDLYQHTLRPMMLESEGGQCFFIGTPKGPGLFQAMYEWGQDPLRPEWCSFHHTTFDNPLLAREGIEELRRTMPEQVFREEILAEFMTQERAVFRDVEAIANAPPEEQPDPTAAYVIGVDLARVQDFTVLWVGRADTGTAVYCDRFQGIPWHLQAERIARLASHYGHAVVYADASGVGDAVCAIMQELGVGVIPVVFSKQSKQQLINHLAIGIERRSLRMIPHQQTLRELNAYRYQDGGGGHTAMSGSGGMHDDCVIALALCHWGMLQYGGGFILGSRTMSSELD